MELSETGWRRLIPNLATALSLLLGLGAIEAARFGDPDLALRFVLLAVLTDGIDGALARRIGVVSSFGGHLDALSDIVAFGIAPGILFAAQHPDLPGPIRVLVMATIALAGAWRLARFQAEPPGRDFTGLPITCGGPLFALAVAGFQPASPAGAVAWGLLLAWLMVSRVPFPRFTTGSLGRVAPIVAALFVLALAVDGKVPAGQAPSGIYVLDFVIDLAVAGKLALASAQAALVGYVAWGLVRSLGLVTVGGRPAAGGRRD